MTKRYTTLGEIEEGMHIWNQGHLFRVTNLRKIASSTLLNGLGRNGELSENDKLHSKPENHTIIRYDGVCVNENDDIKGTTYDGGSYGGFSWVPATIETEGESIPPVAPVSKWQADKNLVAEAVASFPSEFQVRASAVPFGNSSDTFRISPSASYVNDSDDVQLVIERRFFQAGEGSTVSWLEYGKVGIAELSDFIILPEPTVIGTVDITPESLKTPEGVARVNAAMREFEDATADIANRLTSFFEDYEMDIRQMFTRFINSHGGDGGNYAGVLEEMNDLRDAIKQRALKQDAMLRAIAGRA